MQNRLSFHGGTGWTSQPHASHLMILRNMQVHHKGTALA